jgi:hypothetical protein
VNQLNKGRCSRCMVSLSKPLPDTNKTHLFCPYHNNWCRIVARFVCKSPPMGLTVDCFKEWQDGKKEGTEK